MRWLVQYYASGEAAWRVKRGEGQKRFAHAAERHDAERHTSRQSIQRDTNRAALERQMARTQRTGAFGEDDQLAAVREQLNALAQGGIVLAVILLLVFARDGDAAEEQAREEAPKQLGRDQKNAARHHLVINKAVHGAVTMQGNIQGWAAFRQSLRMQHCEALEVDAHAQPVTTAVPKPSHAGGAEEDCLGALRAGRQPLRMRRSNGTMR